MKKLLKIISFALIAQLNLLSTLTAQNLVVNSPDNRISVTVSISDRISWSTNFDQKTVIEKSTISMDMGNGRILGRLPKLKSNKSDSFSKEIIPQIPYKDAKIQSEYNQLTMSFRGDYQLIFRAYDDGISYRFVDNNKKSEVVVSEELTIDFPEGSSSFFPKEDSMYSHNERLYLNKALSELNKGDFCSLPVMFETGDVKVLFTEAALQSYPGMFLEVTEKESMKAIHPKYVLKAIPNEESSPDRNQILTEKADYIAKVSGKREYPWRVFMISDDDRTFVESNLVTKLSDPSKIADASWIKPGQVAWDWYNANNIYGVDFESGINTETYKYYIDFASKNGIKYIMLDEGWTKSTTEILESNENLDLPELVKYGKSKNVDIILWVLWKPLDENMDNILKLYSGWGTKGIKVDFMQRSDQYMVESLEKIAETAAKYKMLVDYHGAFKPAGIERVWPNIINYEAVKGNENNKWSADVTPEHNVTIPFIRMAAGPIDFTPGSMINTNLKNYAPRFTRPMSMGTRCHQVAMYVVYDAPLQMLCESPTIYLKEQETVDFITQIPTVWDETKVLEGSVANYIIVARRKGDNWYIGGMTDWTPREFTVDLSFLSEGSYSMELMQDGVNASKNAQDYKRKTMDVDNTMKALVNMAPGGGWVAILSKK